ncbi:MAG: NAD-dependent epimerase/dehydratase family protein [Leptospiraceae bacterium]|nr:NAD-dependent epimerase/dehydratase family protein [Leptospiraceae bacterium]
MRVLVTGAAGYLGRLLLKELAGFEAMATDLAFREPASNAQMHLCDIRKSDEVDTLFASFRPDAVVHLASVVNPRRESRNLAFEVDVIGTRNILEACKKYGTRRLIVSSSGAAYGYHADNPVPLKESDPVRGNPEFPYSHHKRIIEEELAAHGKTGALPDLVIFRSGTILGETTSNQITALFHKPSLPGVKGSDSPFVFIWDMDAVGAILRALAVQGDEFVAPAGVFNLAGDGWMTIDAMATSLQVPVKRWPAWFLKALFAILRPLRLSRYGPEQVRFLQYRPVLDNGKLKSEFGFLPQKSSLQTFEFYCRAHGIGSAK